jgi:hypothetical protein
MNSDDEDERGEAGAGEEGKDPFDPEQRFPAPDSPEDRPEPIETHPLFPREATTGKLPPESRDIWWLAITRKRNGDGKRSNFPDDLPAHERAAATSGGDPIRSWGDIARRWGGGLYKVCGKDRKHQIVAWAPGRGEHFEIEGRSKPMGIDESETEVSQAWLESPAMRAPILAPAQPPLPPAPLPQESGLTAVATMVAQSMEAMRLQGQQQMEAMRIQGQQTMELMKAVMMREPQHRAPLPQDNGLMVAMINAQSQVTSAVLTALTTEKKDDSPNTMELLRFALESRKGESSSMKETVETLGAMRQLFPAQQQGPSEIGEIGGLITGLATLEKTTSDKDRDYKREEGRRERPPAEATPRIRVQHPQLGVIELVDPSPELLRELEVSAPKPLPAVRAAPAAVAVARAQHAPAPSPPQAVATPTPLPVAVAAPSPAPASTPTLPDPEAVLAALDDPAFSERMRELLLARERARASERAASPPAPPPPTPEASGSAHGPLDDIEDPRPATAAPSPTPAACTSPAADSERSENVANEGAREPPVPVPVAPRPAPAAPHVTAAAATGPPPTAAATAEAFAQTQPEPSNGQHPDGQRVVHLAGVPCIVLPEQMPDPVAEPDAARKVFRDIASSPEIDKAMDQVLPNASRKLREDVKGALGDLPPEAMPFLEKLVQNGAIR